MTPRAVSPFFVLCCGLVFALCAASPLYSEETVVLDDEFSHAAKEGKASVPEMIRRLNAALPGTTDDINSLYFSETYAAAAREARGAELDQLAGILRAIPANSFDFNEAFSAYTAARIREQVEQLRKKPARIKWASSAKVVPNELADAPASFRDAWKLYQTVLAPYLALVLPPEKMEAPRTKLPALEVDLKRVVGKPEPRAWKHLVAHVWGHWCGTGSESLYHPRNRALLLSFLADGRMQEAAGAALAQVPSMFSFGHEDRFESVAVDLLTALGLDWEQVMFGSLVPITSYDMANRRPVVYSRFGECDPWRLLAARGSERAVRQCLDLIRWARLDPRNAGEFLVAALGPEPTQPDGMTFSTDRRLVRSVALPQATRSEVVLVLAEYLAPTNSPADLVATMDTVPAHCVKDLREPLAALVTHRVHAVAAKAHDLLREAKLASDDETVVAATPPLHFRVLLNGKPLSNVEVSVNAIAKRAPVTITASSEQREPPFSRALAPDQNLMTYTNGEIQYSLEKCLEPERIASVRFRIEPPSYPFPDDELLQLLPEQAPKPPTNEWPGPWIVHQVEVHAGDAEVHEVDLRVADLEVRLPEPPEITPGVPVKIMLRRADSREPFSSRERVAKALANAGGSAFFRRLQSGKYIVSVSVPGMARYDSDEIMVGDAVVTHAVKLAPGRNVRGTAVFPDGTKQSLTLAAQLFMDGVEVPRDSSEEWKGLSFGKYTVRIRSTHDWEREAKKAGFPPYKFAKEERRNAREVSFVIDASTPATLDLGKIIVPREK